MKVPQSTRPDFGETVRYFNPAWPAAVMGIAVVPHAARSLVGGGESVFCVGHPRCVGFRRLGLRDGGCDRGLLRSQPRSAACPLMVGVYLSPRGTRSVVSRKVSGFEGVHWFYVGAVLTLFGIWITVATQTAIAVWTGKVLESPH